jgi:hypothetical protein
MIMNSNNNNDNSNNNNNDNNNDTKNLQISQINLLSPHSSYTNTNTGTVLYKRIYK